MIAVIKEVNQKTYPKKISTAKTSLEKNIPTVKENNVVASNTLSDTDTELIINYLNKDDLAVLEKEYDNDVYLDLYN